MHALIVFTHPDSHSLTHAVATQLADGVRHSAPTHSVELADLAATIVLDESERLR